MAQIKFYTGTTAAWKNLNVALGGKGYDENAIYFLTDSYQICKGGHVLAQSYEIVATLPTVEEGKENVLYVVTGERKLYTFNGLSYDSKFAFDTEIATSVTASEEKAVSGKAVYDFVVEQLKDLTGGTLDAYVTAVSTKEGENGVLVVTKGEDKGTEVRLTGVVIDPTYDATTRVLTLPRVDGQDLIVNLGKDMVVQSGHYDAENKKIILVLNDEAATEVEIDAAGLVDTYISGSVDTDPVKIEISNHEISTTVAVDGTIIKVENGTITADLSAYALATVTENLNGRVESLEETIYDETEGLVTKVSDLTTRVGAVEKTVTENFAASKKYTDDAVNALASTSATARETLKTEMQGYTNQQIGIALNWNNIAE